MSNEERARGVAAAQAARGELYDTLGQLKHQLNYARRIDEAVDRTKRRIAALQHDKPVVFAAGVAASAAVVGLAAWRVAVTVARRFGD